MGRIPIAEVCECDTMHNNEADYLSMADTDTGVEMPNSWQLATDSSHWQVQVREHPTTTTFPQNIMLESPPIPKKFFLSSSHTV